MADLQRKQGRGAQPVARKSEGTSPTTAGTRPVMGQKPGDPLAAERKAAAQQIQRSVKAWASHDDAAERDEKGAAQDEEKEPASPVAEEQHGDDGGTSDEGAPDDATSDAKPDAGTPDDAKPEDGAPDEGKPDETKADAKSDTQSDAKPEDGAPDEGKPDETKADAKSDTKPDDAPDDAKGETPPDEAKSDAKSEAKPDEAKSDGKREPNPDDANADAKGDAKADAKGDAAETAARDVPSGQKKQDDDPPKRVNAAEVKRKLFRTPTPSAAGAPAAAAPQPAKDPGPPPVNPGEQKPAAPEGGAEAPRPAALVERLDTAAAMGVSGPPPDTTPPLQAAPAAPMQKLPEGVAERFNRSVAEAPVPDTRDMKPDMDKVAAEEATVAPEEAKFKAGQGPSAAYGQAGPPEAKAAIAPKLEPPPLPADGILGVVAAGNFIAAAAAIGANWANYKGADSGAQRAAAYMTAVNAQLTGPGEVGPPVNHVPQKMGAGAYGHMDASAWALVLNTDMFEDKANVREAPTPTNATPRDDLAQTATGVYHEARHAEQWHKMARTRAGQFKETPAQIQTAMPNMNAAAIADAAGKKLGTPEAPTDARFLAWFESVYDPVKGAERSNILSQWRATLAARTTAGEEFKRTYEAADVKGKARNAKGAEWTTQKAVVDPLFATYTPLQQAYDQKKIAYDAKAVERTAATQTWRDKQQARDALIPPGRQAEAQRLTAWNTLQSAKQTETTARATRDQADADRVTKQQAHVRAMATFTQKEQAYQPLWDAYQRAQTDVAAYNAARSFSEQQYQPARDAANGTWAAVTAAETKFQADHAAYLAAQQTATTAENDWKTADAAFQAALTAYTAANTAFGEADAAWRRIDGEFQTLTREAQAAWQAAKTAYDTYKVEQDKLDQISAAYRTLETEFNALFAPWQAAKTAWEAADAAWKPWDQKYHALPEEVDAYRTEQIIGIEYRSRYPAT